MFFYKKAIESLTKELNIVDQDLNQMNKRQKCSLSNVNNPLNDNPILSTNSTNDLKQELSSTLNHTTTANDTVPNWVQSGGQVRFYLLKKFRKKKFCFKRIFAQHQI